MERNVLIHLTISAIGILIGISAFFVFFVGYGNHDVGFWSMLSGAVAGVCFNLHWVKGMNSLEAWHTRTTLRNLHLVGLCSGLAGFTAVIWYLFLTFYYKIPVVPICDSTAISAVWALICGKWGLTLMYFTYKYELIIGESPILTESSA